MTCWNLLEVTLGRKLVDSVFIAEVIQKDYWIANKGYYKNINAIP